MGLKKSLKRSSSPADSSSPSPGLSSPGPSISPAGQALSPTQPSSLASRRQLYRAKLLDLAEPALEELSRQITSPNIDPDVKRELALQILKDSGVSARSGQDLPGEDSSHSLPALAEALKAAFQGLGLAFGVKLAEKKLGESLALNPDIQSSPRAISQDSSPLAKIFQDLSPASRPGRGSSPSKPASVSIPGMAKVVKPAGKDREDSSL